MNSRTHKANVLTMTAVFLFVTAAAALAASAVGDARTSEMSPMARLIMEAMADAAQNMQ